MSTTWHSAADAVTEDALFPDAEYLVLSSRLIPDLDGGYTIATLARARQMAETGVTDGSGPQLLTFDPGSAAAHAEHRAVFAERGAIVDPARMRNLFDEASDAAGGAASWLRAAATAGEGVDSESLDDEKPRELEYRVLSDSDGRPYLALPVIADNPDWHLTTASVRVYGSTGDVVGVLRGFRALYQAWLDDVVRRLGERPVVVICESRQLGELVVDWSHPRLRIVHTVHTIHLESPYTPDAPLNALWSRWFDVVDRFDAVIWPTRKQRDDVVERFGGAGRHLVVPSGSAHPEPSTAEREPGLVVALARLAPGKRIDHTIRAFATANVPGTTLEIWGDGPERSRLQTLIDDLAITDRVRLAGHADDPGRVLDRASLLISSTAFEGQGLSLVEALAHACPVVSYDVRYGPRDILGGGGGILVPDGDEDALATALRTMLTDGDLRATLAAAAPASAAIWSPEQAMTALAAAVRTALAAPPRG